jgi:hypothetical protein
MTLPAQTLLPGLSPGQVAFCPGLHASVRR